MAVVNLYYRWLGFRMMAYSNKIFPLSLQSPGRLWQAFSNRKRKRKKEKEEENEK